jgi:hypothetical protein
MNDTELYDYILASDIFKKWHWFNYHFSRRLFDSKHPLAESFIESCILCDQKIPGFAKKMVDDIAALSGNEKFEPHYEQLLQKLAELFIIRQVVTFDWGTEIVIEYEPTAGSSKKNPEIVVKAKEYTVGIEVKAPALFSHIRVRKSTSIQIVARSPYGKHAIQEGKTVTLPRDNPIKDFLISADGKFEQFKIENPAFLGLLVIVWDDHVYEPITSLLHPAAGLFTPNSFAKDSNNQPFQFVRLDGVILVRHLHQLLSSSRDEPLMDGCKHPFDYGIDGQFPPKIFIPTPKGNTVPPVILDCFQAKPRNPLMGAEYIPTDFVHWVHIKRV